MIKILITKEDFDTLIEGKSVTKQHNDIKADILLQDIGYDVMIDMLLAKRKALHESLEKEALVL